MCILASCETFTWEAPLPSDHSTACTIARSVHLVLAAIK